MNNFSKLVVLMAALSVSACAQLNAKKMEPEIQSRIDTNSANYLSCMKAYAAKYAAVIDSPALLVDGAGVECSELLQLVEADTRELLAMKYMSKSYQTKVLAEQLLALEKQARAEVVNTAVKARSGEL